MYLRAKKGFLRDLSLFKKRKAGKNLIKIEFDLEKIRDFIFKTHSQNFLVSL